MSVKITKGRGLACKSSLGGVAEIYLFPFVKYRRSEIVLNGNELVSFPETTIYQFECVNLTVTESQQENEGGKFYNQNINFSLIGIDAESNVLIEKFLLKDYRAIIKDNNGVYKLLGIYTGLECTNLSQVTGGAKTDLNGYNLSFEGKEEKEPIFIPVLEQCFGIENGGNLLLESEGCLLLESSDLEGFGFIKN